MDVRIIVLCSLVALTSVACKKDRKDSPARARTAPEAKVETKTEQVPGATLPAHPSLEPQVVQLDNGKIIVVSDFMKGKKNLCGAVKEIEFKEGTKNIDAYTPVEGLNAGQKAEISLRRFQAGLCVTFPCGAIEFDVMNKLGAEGKLEAMSREELMTLNKSLSTLSSYLKLNYGHNFNTCTVISRTTKEETPIILDDVLAFQKRVNAEYFKKLSK